MTCAADVIGQYVYIYLTESEALTVCEVTVFGGNNANQLIINMNQDMNKLVIWMYICKPQCTSYCVLLQLQYSLRLN